MMSALPNGSVAGVHAVARVPSNGRLNARQLLSAVPRTRALPAQPVDVSSRLSYQTSYDCTNDS